MSWSPDQPLMTVFYTQVKYSFLTSLPVTADDPGPIYILYHACHYCSAHIQAPVSAFLYGEFCLTLTSPASVSHKCNSISLLDNGQ